MFKNHKKNGIKHLFFGGSHKHYGSDTKFKIDNQMFNFEA
jgi:hypothetical protein